MNLVQELDKEIIEAMKAKDSVRLATLRGVKGAIKEFEKGNRQDLIDKTKEEIDILSKYLPEQLSEDEIITIINQVFEEVKPSGIKDMGKVMGKVTPLVKGKADMGLVSSLIKEKLNS